MSRLALAALPAAVVAAAAIVGSAGASTAKLEGTVGPGFTIELKQGGKDVKTLAAGRYRIKVEDKGSIHDFHLFGPGGVNRKTGISFTGTQTWTVTLKPGRYTYQCDPHAALGMKDTFRVKR
jgi:plastocyanin